MNYYGKNMVNRFEQIELYSPAEYQRRIRAICDMMKEQNVQVLLFCECAEEAYDHWLTGRWYLDAILVYESGEVIGILWDELDETACAASAVTDYGRYKMQKPYEAPCDGIQMRNRISDRALAQLAASRAPERVGLVLPGQMTRGLRDALKEALPQAEWEDLSIPTALVRAVKSPEELYAAKQARDIQVKLFDAYDQIIRVGRNMEDINMELQHLLHEMGATGVVNARVMNRGAQDEPAPFFGYPGPVKYGDRLYTLLEATGPGMHHVAFGRYMSMGEPSKDYAKMIADAISIHKFAVSHMKPGTTLAQIAVQTRKYANSLGYLFREQVGWNWMHSLGAFFYEQLSLEDYTENVPLPENIILHCHPTPYRRFPAVDPYATEEVEYLNTYFITGDGQQDLIQVPFELRILGE